MMKAAEVRRPAERIELALKVNEGAVRNAIAAVDESVKISLDVSGGSDYATAGMIIIAEALNEAVSG